MSPSRRAVLPVVATTAAFLVWLAAVVAAGVAGAQLDNGWLTLLAVGLLFGGWLALGLLDRRPA